MSDLVPGRNESGRWPADIRAGLVVFLVALPLCLGIAVASQTPPISGIIAGIIGGIVVGLISGSQTSVSGPAAGLTAVIIAQVSLLGSFEAFLAAVTVAGVFQLIMGAMRAGFLASFFPSSVIKGLLAAIGLILILKQIPHVVGHDTDPEGDMAFQQIDHENTFSEIGEMLLDFHPGAALIGLVCIPLLIFWEKNALLRRLPLPGPLIVVLFGLLMAEIFRRIGGPWLIQPSHLVEIPVNGSLNELMTSLQTPDWGSLARSQTWLAAVTIAIVASLETLLNVEAVDAIDPRQRVTPPSRELIAQGAGNVLCGLIGGLPVTSVIVRSSVNVHAGARTRASAVIHGVLLAVFVLLLPELLNRIPISCLAAILLVTGFKLASPKLIRRMWQEGRYQFIPFAITVVAIVFTDLLVGILIGLAVSVGFILHSNFRRPLRKFIEHHVGGDVLRIELASQVSFLNRPALERVLRSVPSSSHILLDGRKTEYLDPDVLAMIHDFRDKTAPALGVTLSVMGFRERFQLPDCIQYQDFANRELQSRLTPDTVLELLKQGNQRFQSGNMLTRNYGLQVSGTAGSQHPLAVVLSCIDSRTPAEPLFDVGLGDIFSIRIAGNIISPRVLGSMEYGCTVAGARLVIVMGHTRCGAVTSAIRLAHCCSSAADATGCQNLDSIITDIQSAIPDLNKLKQMPESIPEPYIDDIAARNVAITIDRILQCSETLKRLDDSGTIRIVGCLYDVCSGKIRWFDEQPVTL